MKRILVPTDFSTPSLAALTQAIHYTQAVGGELLLLHVVEDAPLRWYTMDGFPESPSALLEPTAQLVLPQPPQTRVSRDQTDLLAATRGLPFEAIAAATTDNFHRLFQRVPRA